MSSTTVSSSNCHHLINKSLEDYADHTGIDLKENPFAEKLQNCDSANAIFDLLQERAKAFKEYRDGNRKLIDCLSPVVQVLHTFSGILGEATALVPFPPAKAIFVGVDVLFAAAGGVRSSYDALVDLFECVGHFLKRLQIYTEIPLTPAMIEIIVKIMVEVLSVLALATKQIKQGRFKKFAKKLFGESEIEAVLQRLGRLTDDEARMTVAQTLEVVHGLVNNVKVVMDDGKASTNDILHALVTMQEAINEINKMKREQLPKGVPTWLSPPDPSKNHNISRRNHHSGTAAWFTHGCIFEEWKTTGSLLWIHGKPGSGKSVLCSAIIQEIKAINDAGLALMGYFYCDFRDTAKQDVTGLLTSLISQLSTTSDLCYDILSDLYSRHNAGSLQPDDDALMQCLKDMLEVAGQPLTYIVVDALDECPNTSGVVSNRGRVLRLVKELVNLELPNLRLCITSRREADIVATLEPLASHTVSLQDQTGQKNDIAEYIKYVIHSDPRTRRWREDKELVIDILVRNADGMFRWVVCQLETLLRCFPASLRVALNKLPKTLDETYHRILLGIEEENREYAHRLLQCLTVSFRPLRVEELAEVLAIRFDNGDTPNYHRDWRMEDAQEAVLSACSSLIAIVNVDGSSIVQFSHFSVKEFLISDRLADASENLSRYHVLLRPAHTILAQASLSALLRLDDQVDKSSMKNYPLSIYAAQHWVEHGQFENVSSYIQALMEQLFDSSKPHFSTWVWIYDVDRPWDWVDHMSSERPRRPEAVALYYATLCGFRSPVEHLIANYPGDVNAWGGTHSTPLHAALTKRYFDIALMLLEHGADVNILDEQGGSPLHKASVKGHRDTVAFLLARKKAVKVHGKGKIATLRRTLMAFKEKRKKKGGIALDGTRQNGELDATRGSLRHEVAVDFRDSLGQTALTAASQFRHLDIVQLLLQNGAAVDSRSNDGTTPLQAASRSGHRDVVQLLLENGAVVDSRPNNGRTPLQAASRFGHCDVVQLLLENGAAVGAHHEGWTSLGHASAYGHLDVVQLLLQNGAAVDSRSNNGTTPLQAASRSGYRDVVQLLLENGAAVDAHSHEGWTSLGSASSYGHLDVVQLLFQNGAAIDSCSNDGGTPLQEASRNGHLDIVHLLLQNGTPVDSHDYNGWTACHTASWNGHLDIVRLLLDSGSDVSTRDRNKETPLDLACRNGKRDVATFLAELMGIEIVDRLIGREMTTVDVASRNADSNFVESSPSRGENADVLAKGTSLHTASEEGNLDTVRSLLDHGADVNKQNPFRQTPLHLACWKGRLEVAKFLIQHDANVDIRDKFGWTSLHIASYLGHLDVVRLLLDQGIDINAKALGLWTSLHAASNNGHLEVVKLLLERGANVHAQSEEGWTPSQVALNQANRGIARLLSEYGAH